MHSALSDFKKCRRVKKRRRKKKLKRYAKTHKQEQSAYGIISFLLAFLLLDYDEEIVMIIDQLSFEAKGHVVDGGGGGGAGCELLNNLCTACS